jgi:ABC-type Fe3+-hydroxamate transport system substrate-binding protein
MEYQTSIDQLGNKIEIPNPVQRIISLVPSQTELLFTLGLDDEVVGITKFCVHPEGWLKKKAVVGGTKNFHFETIDSLKPDLIIANKEENYKEGIEQLQQKYPVWISDIFSLQDAISMIQSVGVITGKETNADVIAKQISSSFQQLKKRSPLKVLYLIWRKPWMAAGNDTFINTMIEAIGWQNCVKQSRYPELSAEDIKALQPDVILLSSEPYPFKEKHQKELKEIVPSSKVILVDGEMFSWYGSRLIKAPEYFNNIIIS